MRLMYQDPFCVSISRSRASEPEHGARIRQQGPIDGERAEIRERPPHIAGDDVEQSLRGRREEPDIEIEVEKQRCNIGAVEHVLQIVGGRALPLQRFLKLRVESGEFLIERLQFFLRRQQFLVRRLEFLVDGQRLFVDGLLFFTGNLQIVDGAFEFGARDLQFLFQFNQPRRVTRDSGARASAGVFRRVYETDEQKLFAVIRNRFDGDAERTLGLVAGQPASGNDSPCIFLTGSLNCRSELGSDAVARHGEQIVNGFARCDLQIAVGRTQEIKTLVFAIDQDRSRRENIDHRTLANLRKSRLARRSLLRHRA